MNGLEGSVSKLSLENNSKKHKRPFRAFHSFNEPTNQYQNFGAIPHTASTTESSFLNPQSGATTHPLTANEPAPPSSHLVPEQRILDQQQMLTRTFVPAAESPPPLATTQFYSSNQNCCDPRFMSLSVYNIPESETLRAATKLPISVNVQPFAKTAFVDGDVPLVPLEGDGPLRCRRCRAYVNPKSTFTYDSKMVCNYCQIKTQVSQPQYFSMGANGQNLGSVDRQELNCGVVDFLVPSEYHVKPNQPTVPLHYVFLVDISSWANENKSSLTVLEGVRTSITYIAEHQPNCKVAIIAFDRWLRFFNLRPEANRAQELVVSELSEVFLPLFHGLFARPAESMHVIQDTLLKLETFIQDDKFSHKNEACFGSAIDVAMLALQTCTNGNGGKIIASLNMIPTLGEGNLSISKDDGTKKHLNCENEFYTKIAQSMLKSYVSIDLFCTGSAFMDLATIGHPSLVTSGRLQYYPNFNIDKDEFILVNDMLHSVSSNIGYQAQLKVRCSSGLSVQNYLSVACGNSDKDPIIPVVTTDQSFDVLFKYDEVLRSRTDVYFQAAILYTDLDGNRKVRTINTTAAVSTSVGEIFKFANQNVITSSIIRDILSKMKECNVTQLRKTIDTRLTEILAQYRAHVDGSSSTQLILPDALKFLPAYFLSFKKSYLLHSNNYSSRDNDRVVDYFKFWQHNQPQFSYKLYPQIFPLHELLTPEDYTFYDENNLLLQLYSTSALTVRNSHSALVNGGCYLIFQGDLVYLWFNENTNPHLLHDLLSIKTPADSINYAHLSLFGAQFPVLETDINSQARNIIQYWARLVNRSFLPVLLLRPNVDSYYSQVLAALMCEDKSVESLECYDNYLLLLHRTIKENVQQDRFTKLSSFNKEGNDSIAQRFIHF
ncbi:HBR352Cp [Eremothecium sinecaudum]|uniref:HBR352Cp n=1 Tax=Eremothecium sinecaudum TaxID=45286 RepID=A0A109UXG0_9SACH|nr:HBR352Cp [Eremothecium sinecaudum]AMD19253.1 HBR352Cp [Eremothecium sinecaudum]